MGVGHSPRLPWACGTCKGVPRGHPPATCELCEARFAHACAVVRHSAVVHGIPPSQSRILALRALYSLRGWPVGPLPASLAAYLGGPSLAGLPLQGGHAPSRPSCPNPPGVA